MPTSVFFLHFLMQQQQMISRTMRPPAPPAIGIIGRESPKISSMLASAPLAKSSLTVVSCSAINANTAAFSSLVPSVQYSMAKVVLKDSFAGTAESVKLDPFSTSYCVFREVELFIVVYFFVFSFVIYKVIPLSISVNYM